MEAVNLRGRESENCRIWNIEFNSKELELLACARYVPLIPYFKNLRTKEFKNSGTLEPKD